MPESNSSAGPAQALLQRLKAELPELIDHAAIVGQWVWLEFNTPPLETVRARLKELGFHWNRKRRCWQHPCGAPRGATAGEPRAKYPVTPATSVVLNERLLAASEYKVIALRECPLPEELHCCETPEHAAAYWNLNIKSIPHFNPECECFAVLLLNTRRRVKGHQLISIGTLDTILVHPREVFRGAIIAAASAIVLMHNHPSGEAEPSEADIKVTRDLIRAGQLLKIEVIDHVIIGRERHASLRSMGYFYS